MSDRLSNLLRARRMFDVLTAEDAPKAARHLQDDQLRGAFIETERPKALYIDGDRGTRRHEVMHGIRWAASQDPELQSVLPWWARGAERGSFRDELLARLASKRDGDLLEWDLGRYAEMEPQAAAAYRAAKPVQAVARFAYDNPITAGALAGGTAVGVPTLVYGLSQEDKPDEEAIAAHFDKMIDRLNAR